MNKLSVRGCLISYLMLAFVIVLIDQLTKQWVFNSMPLHSANLVTSFFDIVHARNYGAAFGFLNDGAGWQTWFFGAVALIASIVIIRWLSQIAGVQRQLSFALALVLGGALGNLIDRIWLGFVVDFLSFHYNGLAFPAFNVADSAICIGAFLLVLDSFNVRVIRDYKG
ncbi:MAG: signal peptidase II [Saprospiraceae bacterium]|jgi:signal peptidase II